MPGRSEPTWSVWPLVRRAMAGDERQAVSRWAASGAMQLTGITAGAELVTPARLALAMDALAARVASLTGQLGRRVDLDGASLLGERAALAGLQRHGSVSCGAGCRLLATADGWLAVSLVREGDLELLDAWLEHDLAIPAVVPVEDEHWTRLSAHLRHRATAPLSQRAALLGLPVARLGEVEPQRAVPDETVPAERVWPRLTELVVVDLSSLWAGPLCANVLGLAGARVIKVESVSRADGARRGPRPFFDLLHAGHDSVAVDLAAAEDVHALRRLLAAADIVIEASRPRALAALELDFATMSATGWRGVWVAITAYGGTPPRAVRVGFGDDAAVAGGLVAWQGDQPCFVADAVADPATGLVAATSVLQALAANRRGLVPVALADTAAHLAAGIAASPVPRHPEGLLVKPPIARPAPGRAHRFGADTAAVMHEFAYGMA